MNIRQRGKDEKILLIFSYYHINPGPHVSSVSIADVDQQ
jgi:hypothetical protein